MKFDEMIKKRLNTLECKPNTIPQWDQGDTGIPTVWYVKITISELASLLNFWYPGISKVEGYTVTLLE